MKITFISYNNLPEYTSPEKWISRIDFFVIIMEALAKNHEVHYIGQIGWSGDYLLNGVRYHFLSFYNKKPFFPRRLNLFAKKIQPDVVVVPGFHFPLQVLQLRITLGKKAKLILEHHADKPPKGFKKNFQKLTDRFIDGYNFTSLGNAKEWIDSGIITRNKCYEIPGASGIFSKKDKQLSRVHLNINDSMIFLWVGGLDKNKDPLTVLKAFAKYLQVYPHAQLHMIFNKENILPQVKEMIGKSELLSEKIFLHGNIQHSQLEHWYNAADFFISGSHREGGSIALLEAMSCGCIPVVTKIPAALKVTANGSVGLNYEAGDAKELYNLLILTNNLSINEYSEKVHRHFIKELSADAIAKKFTEIVNRLDK